MTFRSMARGLTLIAALAVAAPALAWKPVVAGQPFVHKKSGFSVQMPEGWNWMKGAMVPGEVASTRDGPDLQLIFVDWRKHKGAFYSIKEDATPDMMPQEVAEKFAAHLRESGGRSNMEILANEPVVVAGLPGFRLHLTSRRSVDVGSVRYEDIIVGVNTPMGLYTIFYRAPVLHYFQRDTAAFDGVVASFVLNEAPAKKR